MVTITSHIFINIFQTVHFSAVKLDRSNEKNMNFLLIPKSPKVWEKFEAIGPVTFKCKIAIFLVHIWLQHLSKTSMTVHLASPLLTLSLIINTLKIPITFGDSILSHYYYYCTKVLVRNPSDRLLDGQFQNWTGGKFWSRLCGWAFFTGNLSVDDSKYCKYIHIFQLIYCCQVESKRLYCFQNVSKITWCTSYYRRGFQSWFFE